MQFRIDLALGNDSNVMSVGEGSCRAYTDTKTVASKAHLLASLCVNGVGGNYVNNIVEAVSSALLVNI